LNTSDSKHNIPTCMYVYNDLYGVYTLGCLCWAIYAGLHMLDDHSGLTMTLNIKTRPL
jgi:hypothetical protein